MAAGEVAPLSCWAGLEEQERQRAVRGLLAQVEAEARTRGGPLWAQGQVPYLMERTEGGPIPAAVQKNNFDFIFWVFLGGVEFSQ